MLIKKNLAYKIFQIAWIYFLIVNIADLRLHTKIDLIPSIHVSEIPFIRYLTFLIAAFLLIPIKELINVFKEKRNLVTIIIVAVLIGIGYVSSALSDYPQTAYGVVNRISFYFAAFIFSLAAVRYFEGAKDFMVRAFIYSGVLVIAGSMLDFYVPPFHELLVKHFDRPEAYHSLVRIGGERIMRPMGFLTDSNLTAFSLSMALLLLLFNYKQFGKTFRYSFYALSSYCIGMLASRASLLICIISIAVFYFSKKEERKELYLFVTLFVLFQLVTPQTYHRFYALFDRKETRVEFSTGRIQLWHAAFNLFKENPIIGAGPGVFFEVSQKYVRNIIEGKYNLNLDKPEYPDYHKIDKKNPHNIFLVMLAETGLTGFIVFLALIFSLARTYLKKKQFISFLFMLNVLIVSFFANFAPYYKFYLVICIVFFNAAESNMKLSSKEEADAR